ncbi:MAG: SDR family oxidoreductase [Holophagales bacterium]|nr:SDR family oxidoreductase [Holophagales bacterium]MYG32374.1 SDR family oxidoreductase [Holophagales bacterium]MYI78458.1 SDR family oxidoreductase [Holophagales bacterium]
MLELGLDGKVAIVTGGSDGMGLATAQRLVSEGARVAICARRAENLERAADQLRAVGGGDVLAQAADVTSAGDVERFIEAVTTEFGGVDILINNAGASAAQGLEALGDDAWMADIELKVMGAVRFCRGVVPSMRERGGGAIVNATIGGGKAAPARALPTSVTRAAGINLTKSLANELAADNIRVNTICIGLIKSEQWVRRAEGQGVDVESIYEAMGKRVPLGRVGEAEEYADLIAFLVSERGAYITGTAINLDGGLCPVV